MKTLTYIHIHMCVLEYTSESGIESNDQRKVYILKHFSNQRIYLNDLIKLFV